MKIPKNKTFKKQKNVFSETHFKSRDGMLTTVWGPSAWHLLHVMSFNYPVNPTKQDKIHYRNFILNLKNVLPCGKCRSNLIKNFRKLPLRMSDMETRDTFSLYVYKLHELINEMLNKKSGLSYEDVKIRYENFRSRCKPSSLNKTKKNKLVENGCTEPLFGEKSKCILKIVPVTKKCETFQIDDSCLKKRVY